MKKFSFLHVVTPVIAATLLTGCALQGQSSRPCQYPDSRETKAPTWVCFEHMEGGPSVQAVGSYPLSANYSLSKRAAIARAQVRIAEIIGEAAVTGLITVASSDENSVAFQQAKDDIRSYTDQKVKGTRVINQSTSPNNVLYVLVGIEDERATELLNDAISAADKKNPDVDLPNLSREESDKSLDEVQRSK